MVLYDTTILYDVLGVSPASTQLDISDAYRRLVKENLGHEGEPNGSVWWRSRLLKINELTAAATILIHGDRRSEYDAKLAADGLICSLCAGSGIILKDRMGCGGTACSACGGTGRGWKFESIPEKK